MVLVARRAQPLLRAAFGMAGVAGERAAVGYEFDGAARTPASAIDWSLPHASVETVDDLLTWVRSWRDDDRIPTELREPAWAARALRDDTLSDCGSGWKRCELGGRAAAVAMSFTCEPQARAEHIAGR